MTELNVLALAIFFRGLGVIAAIVGAVYLANMGKDGWGWLIFLAIILGSASYSYKPD